MFIVGLDTGKSNIGLALYNTKTKKFKTHFIDKGKCLKFENNTNQSSVFREIYKEVNSFIKRNTKGKPVDVLVVERFMIVGRLNGMVGEIANIFIGIVISAVKPKEIYMITASSWKRTIKPKYNKILTPHEQDAKGIIMYYLKSKTK